LWQRVNSSAVDALLVDEDLHWGFRRDLRLAFGSIAGFLEIEYRARLRSNVDVRQQCAVVAIRHVAIDNPCHRAGVLMTAILACEDEASTYCDGQLSFPRVFTIDSVALSWFALR